MVLANSDSSFLYNKTK